MRGEHTVVTADAGYHSQDNMQALLDGQIPAMVADGLMRKRDERLAGQLRHKAKPDPLHDKTESATQQGMSISRLTPRSKRTLRDKAARRRLPSRSAPQ